MINQVLPANIADKKAFKDFAQPQNGYYINTPVAEQETRNLEEEQKKKSHKYGKTIVSGALIVGFGTLALFSGGLNKGVVKLLNKLKIKLEQKTSKDGQFKNFYRFALRRVNSFIEKSGSINNFTTLKDVACQRLMWGKKGDRIFTRKIHEGITNFFDGISRKTVNSSYAKTHKKFASLNEYFSTLNEQILRQNPNDDAVKAVIQGVEAKIVKINTNFEKGFGLNARNERLREIHSATDGLFDFFWDASFKDVRNFKSKNMWQTFIAEDYMLPAKMKLANKTSVLRQAITHDIVDNYKATKKALDNIQKFINPADSATNDILAELRKNLNSYKKLSGDNELVQRNVLNKEISANLKKLSDCYGRKSKEFGYNSEAVNSIASYVAEVEDVIAKSSKGELQEILTIYKKYLPRKEYLKLKSQVESAIKSLDNSIDIETVQYVDKARDLRLGSAPTDVLSIVGTVGAVGYYLNKADGKDEKISASLKYGIPAIGAIATSLYSTARLISGGKSMAFGIVSGMIISKIGEAVDNLRKKYALDVSFHTKEMKDMFKPQSDKV